MTLAIKRICKIYHLTLVMFLH